MTAKAFPVYRVNQIVENKTAAGATQNYTVVLAEVLANGGWGSDTITLTLPLSMSVDRGQGGGVVEIAGLYVGGLYEMKFLPVVP